MKLIIFAILLLLGSIPNILVPENSFVGIIGTVIGIAIIAFKIKSSSTSTSSSCSTSSSSVKGWQSKHYEWDLLDKKYKPIESEHFRLLGQIKSAQSAALAARNPNSPHWDRVIELCERDLSLEPSIRQYEISSRKCGIALGYYSDDYLNSPYMNFPSYASLSLAYEKKGDFEAAIAVCQRAIKAGYTISGYEQTFEQRIDYLQKERSMHAVHGKWQVIIDEHAKLLNEIGVAYTIANNLNLPDSPQMQHVIELCKKDIALAEMFIKSQLEIQNVRVANGWSEQKEAADVLPSFPTFKRLAIIYEKQKNYDEAIAVCQHAIELGFVDDGTDGQMPGRIARLMKKQGKSRKKIEPAEEVIIDETSGNVIES